MPGLSREAISIDVGVRLRQLREARKVSMRALAQMSGLSANALSMIERGKTSPSVSTLYRLADALGVPVTDFFSPESTRKKAVFLKADERTRLPFMCGLGRHGRRAAFTGRMMPFMLTLESGAQQAARAWSSIPDTSSCIVCAGKSNTRSRTRCTPRSGRQPPVCCPAKAPLAQPEATRSPAS